MIKLKINKTKEMNTEIKVHKIKSNAFIDVFWLIQSVKSLSFTRNTRFVSHKPMAN